MKTTNDQNRATTTWILDPIHSAVGFRVRHMMVHHVRGEFEEVTGTVRYDAAFPEATSIEAEIPTASVHTRDAQRDAHLRDPDFFDSEMHPTVAFRSTRAIVVGPAALDVIGNLTLRGITREVTFAVTDIAGPQRDHNGYIRMGASATAKIRRSEFGITFKGVGIADEVSLSVDVSLVQDGSR
jgi:polyisoprenoid-binding protein YceI